MTKAYYNEIDPFAAQWLRNLIAKGHIAPGDVDERSILDVVPSDLSGYGQCHFFAGIGGWSLALRLAGWPDDRPVWTGSCPCQPFSAAGKGAGFDDERHLWPAFFHLIAECRPTVVYGEQVASKDGLLWLDLVHTDMEDAGYAFGAADLCAAGVGALHIRQRLYWVADAAAEGLQGCSGGGSNGKGIIRGEPATRSFFGGVADANLDGQSRPGIMGRSGDPAQGSDRQVYRAFNGRGGLADAGRLDLPAGRMEGGRPVVAAEPGSQERRGAGAIDASPSDGFWRDTDWLCCRDGKWRPVEPGAFPLAHGISGRVGRLRAYGNAIVPQVAAAFIESTDYD